MFLAELVSPKSAPFFSSHDVDQCPGADFVSVLLFVVIVLVVLLFLVNEHDVHVTHPPLLLVVIAGAGGRLLLLGLDDRLLVEVLHLIALVLVMGVDGAAQHTDEVSKKPVTQKYLNKT